MEDPRRTLLERLGTLTGQQAAIEAHLRGRDGRLDQDFEDVVSYTAGDEVLEGLDDAARTEIDQIRAALQRVDNGTYGTCTRCGEPIAPARLAALPATPFCRACAA
ncbi:MAG: TraR/DksA C4-type zinc finger protein [Myxococcota bacterium]